MQHLTYLTVSNMFKIPKYIYKHNFKVPTVSVLNMLNVQETDVRILVKRLSVYINLQKHRTQCCGIRKKINCVYYTGKAVRPKEKPNLLQ